MTATKAKNAQPKPTTRAAYKECQREIASLLEWIQFNVDGHAEMHDADEMVLEQMSPRRLREMKIVRRHLKEVLGIAELMIEDENE